MVRGEHPLSMGLDPFASTPRPWRNNWRKITTTHGRKKKQELEAKGEGAHPIPAQTPLLRSSLVTGSGVLRAWVRVARL